MNKFCKIIELPDTQCVLIIEDDHDEDAVYKLTIMLDVNTARMKVTMGFTTKDEQQAAFDSFTQTQAEELFEQAYGLTE